jgi:Flp pilus assembly pilin Flp
MQRLEQLFNDETGTATAEYALMLFLIASVTIAALSDVRDEIIRILLAAGDHLSSLL